MHFTVICEYESDQSSFGLQDIRQKMNKLNNKLLSRILMTLIKPLPGAPNALVNRVVEFVGRERRYRYYSEEGFTSSVAQDHKDYLEKARSLASGSSAQPTEPVQAPTLSDTVAGSPSEKAAAASNVAGPSQQNTASQEPQASTDSVADAASGSMDVDSTHQGNAPKKQSTLDTFLTPVASQAATPERFISVALLTRRKVLLSVLERKRMVEYQASLVAEYQQEKARLFPNQDETSVIDRKTLFRTIHILEAEGLLKVFTVENMPLVGSGTVSKTFCLHPSIDPESEEVKAFVKECSNRHVLFGSLANRPMKKAERVELAAETLEEMQERLGQDFYKAPSIPLADIGAVKPGKDEARVKAKVPQKGATIEYDSMDPAIEYGWNKAKMMRALVFHRFVLDKLGSEDRTLFEFPAHSNVLSASSLFEVMSLRVFLLVVGIPRYPESESKAYLDSNRDSNIPINKTPDYLKPLVAPNLNFKKRLREVLEILDALGLVTPLAHAPQTAFGEHSVEYSINHLVLNTHYQVHVNVRAPLHPLMPENVYENMGDRKGYMLLSPKECRDFWVDLQTSASSMKYVPVERSPGRPWTEIRRSFLLNLCNKKIWADPIRITPSQRETLMTLVNNKIRYIPPPHDPKMDQMSKETGLPKDHIFQFYKAIKAAWHSHPITRRTKRLLKGGGNLGQQEREGKYGVGRPKRTRAKRLLWSDAEDERLLQAYAVLRCVSEMFNIKFSWVAVSNALNDKQRGREVCRHRFDKLVREPSLAKRLDSYRAQFGKLVSDLAGTLEVDRDLRNFDPSPLLDQLRPNVDTSA